MFAGSLLQNINQTKSQVEKTTTLPDPLNTNKPVKLFHHSVCINSPLQRDCCVL